MIKKILNNILFVAVGGSKADINFYKLIKRIRNIQTIAFVFGPTNHAMA